MPFSSRFFSRLSIPLPGVNFITGISLAVIFIQIWLGSMADENGAVTTESAPYYLALGLSWYGISNLWLWQFVSHAFTHANWFHLTINLLMLWFVGGSVIRILGQKYFALIVLAGALAGGGLHVIVDYFAVRAGFDSTPLVGISGACLALLLALTTLSPESRMWPIPVSGRNLGLGIILAELLLLLMKPTLGIPGFAQVGRFMVDHGGAGLFMMSHACHLGGALAGWLMARRLLSPGPSLSDLQRARERREAKMELGDAG
jgi:membrane associated rhomboid family serine protease